MPRVLHVLSQRPFLTGSGVTLDALVRRAALAGWEQCVVAALPAGEEVPAVGGLDPSRVRPVRFGEGEVLDAIPGMSDVMPYPTRRYSAMDAGEIARYEATWVRHLAEVRDELGPEIVHAHHLWLVAARLRELFPDVPIVGHCHGTGLRQMQLCPHLAARVAAGCAEHDRFAVLHPEQGRQVAETLAVAPSRIAVVGAGYREEIFHSRGRETPTGEPSERSASSAAGRDVVYAGKLSRAKGLPWLLDAVERLAGEREIRLHVAGGGAGEEADALRARIRAMAPVAKLHGQLGQEALAKLMRSSAVFALPSMYEGLPLVLIEAAACGCRLVCTDLPGARAQLFPALRPVLDVVAMPRLVGVDEPMEADLPRFVEELARALAAGLDASPPEPRSLRDGLAAFTWDAVFGRVEMLWQQLLDG